MCWTETEGTVYTVNGVKGTCTPVEDGAMIKQIKLAMSDIIILITSEVGRSARKLT